MTSLRDLIRHLLGVRAVGQPDSVPLPVHLLTLAPGMMVLVHGPLGVAWLLSRN